MTDMNTKLVDDNRGQFLILSAIAIVLIILALITLLNVVAFTSIQQADGVTDQSDETVTQLGDTEYAVENSIRHANHEVDETEIADNQDRRDQIDADIERFNDRLSERLGAEGSQVTIERVDYTEGTRFWQQEYSDLQELSNPASVFEDADGARSFTVEITGESLHTPNEVLEPSDIDENSPELFTIDYVTEAGIDGEIYIYEDPDDPDKAIVQNENGDRTHVIAVPENTAQISVTHGIISGKSSDALPRTERITEVEIRHGENIEAALDLVVNRDQGDLVHFSEDATDSPSEDPDGVEVHEAIYSVTTDVSVHSPHSDYTTSIRIAPQLPGDATTEGI